MGGQPRSTERKQFGVERKQVCFGDIPPSANSKVTPVSQPWSVHLQNGADHGVAPVTCDCGILGIMYVGTLYINVLYQC